MAMNLFRGIKTAGFLDVIKNFSEHTTSSVLITDPHQNDNPIIYVNEVFTTNTGYTKEEVLGENCRFLQGDETNPDDRKKIREAIEAEKPVAVEILNYRKDGTAFWNEIFISPIFSEEHKLIYFVGVQHDITHRKQTHQKLVILNQTLKKIYEGEDIHSILLHLCKLLETVLLEKAKVSILLYSSEERRLYTGEAQGLPSFYNEAIDGIEIGPNVGSCGTAVYYNQDVIVDRISESELWRDFWDIARESGLEACWSFLIRAHNSKEILGTFAVYFSKPRKPLPEEIELLEEVAKVAAVALEFHAYTKRINELAYRDMVTGLLNRNYALEELGKEVLVHKKKIAVLFIDLDRFKIINDTYGHAKGDEILQEVARRLTHNLDASCQIARYGGDEFIVCLPFQFIAEVEKVVVKILDCFQRPFQLNEEECYLTSSVGISMSPYDSENLDMLIQFADVAMYRAKRKGLNQFAFYSSAMSSENSENLELFNSVRKAVLNQEFLVYYQPQVDASSRKIVGAEALLRWNHPKKGMISPAVFIPILEETGVIFAVEEQVLYTACSQSKRWQEQGREPIPVHVNISSPHFIRSGFVSTVEKVLQKTGLSPQYLGLEITENVAMNHSDHVMKVFEELSKIGIRMSIDDFGTGYSSLSYLQNYPIDTLKIDQSFVRQIGQHEGSEKIVRMIIYLAQSLGLHVLAEGVETEAQLRYMFHYGCTNIQGYLFSKPVPANELEKLVGDSEWNLIE
ncbi:PAS domain S-box-containing protein/diguanylate cyclase (GGDEF)-like protein [Aneurinibacillus soli]|uniref:Phytochrome-like protein cph2 n=1 Tax=Aneurinibacillus soli TaxID=1500254 RepID=A0A0U5AYB2_9BACL|nr:GGDEF domain-containing protein [Aneurinibacillus soli]PYE62091.1 PAS domain S-box-containing protein/diguanylate cyclase (GGDEF)-like protein [Aneurinibacillus soli]BAU28721.1 Phytochrome-like protein cph2 [Aneurinibacillus soli]